MRKNFGAHASIYPQPVFILAAYGEDGTPCAMNAAWGGISDTEEVSICLSASHKTVKNILARKAFTISMATASQVVACDYVGLVSGNQVPDKFQRAGFHAEKASQVDAPLIQELPMALECELVSYAPVPDGWWAGSSTSALRKPFWTKAERSIRRSWSPSSSTPCSRPTESWATPSVMPSGTEKS